MQAVPGKRSCASERMDWHVYDSLVFFHTLQVLVLDQKPRASGRFITSC